MMDFRIFVKREQIGYGVVESLRQNGGWVEVEQHLFLQEAIDRIQKHLNKGLWVQFKQRFMDGHWESKVYDPEHDVADAGTTKLKSCQRCHRWGKEVERVGDLDLCLKCVFKCPHGGNLDEECASCEEENAPVLPDREYCQSGHPDCPGGCGA